MAKTTKKKTLSTLLVVVLLAVVAIGGMLAYLTDRDSEANVFTVGNVEIDLTEDFDQGTTLIPGVDITKKPAITNTGKNDAWVWMTFSVPSELDVYAEGTTQGSNENVIHWNPLGATTEGYVTEARVAKAIADGYLPEGLTAAEISATGKTWNVFNSLGEGQNVYQEEINDVQYNTYVLMYNKALEPGETTLTSIFNVFLDAHIDIDPEGNWYRVENGDVKALNWNSNTNGNPVIYVSAYAIQKENFTDVKAAYAAYQGQWGENGSEYGNAEVVEEYEGANYIKTNDKGIVNSAGGTTAYRGVFSDGSAGVTSIEVGEGITRLNNRAFCKEAGLTSVKLPSSLTYIDEGVFQQSGIVEIEIPENVTYIGKTAFGACGNLEKIVIKSKNVTIANYVARACANLKEVYIYSDSVTFESGSMYFTNKENADASKITFYVKNQEIADIAYNAFSTSHSYGMLIKSLDGKTTYYNTLK